MARILVHGHRGARALRPENTMAGFEYAIQAGADVLEMDVAVTKDNVLVVVHDPHINPDLCQGPHPGIAIRELTLTQLREYDCGALRNPRFPKQQAVPGARIPTLDEVLSLATGNSVQFNIEIKSFPDRPELAPPPDIFAGLTLATIRKRQLDYRCIVQSFDFRIQNEMHRLAPAIRLAALWEGPPRPFVEIAREARATIVAPAFHLVTPEQVQAAHAAKLEVVPWTANTPEDWRKLIEAGVDGIITDDPQSLIAYLNRPVSPPEAPRSASENGCPDTPSQP